MKMNHKGRKVTDEDELFFISDSLSVVHSNS